MTCDKEAYLKSFDYYSIYGFTSMIKRRVIN
jgi:hypothetical protein